MSAVRSIRIQTPGRLHLGMTSFGNPSVPSFGGVGVMIDKLGMDVQVEACDRLSVTGPFSDRARQIAMQCMEVLSLQERRCAITIHAAPRAHVGLGSGTQLAMAVAAGIHQFFSSDTCCGTTSGFCTDKAFDFARAGRRGRRSCIGIYGFAKGGLIWEGGRFEHEHDQFAPLVAQTALPDDWCGVVLIHRGATGLHGDDEKAAFARLPSVPAEISEELNRIAEHELFPAVLEKRHADFCDAVYRYGSLAGKPFVTESSRLPWYDTIGQLVSTLHAHGVHGVAQSSWGPAVLACCESKAAAEQVVEWLRQQGLSKDYDSVITSFSRHGATMRVD